MNKTSIIGLAAIFLVIAIGSINAASAIIINSVEVPNIGPGEEASLRIEIKNVFGDDAERVSLMLNFAGTPFTPLGSSEDSEDEIQSDDESFFIFRIKADSDAEPGNYEVPYEIGYSLNDDEQPLRKGTIGITIAAEPELGFSVERENPVIGERGKVNLKIINDGLAGAKFVSIKAVSSGMIILSDSEIYIGTINSDDFETASFDVLFTKDKAVLNAFVSYRGFDNMQKNQEISIPVVVYTKERAKELGIIGTSYTPYYIGAVVLAAIAWLVIRSIRKRRRMKASLRQE